MLSERAIRQAIRSTDWLEGVSLMEISWAPVYHDVMLIRNIEGAF